MKKSILYYLIPVIAGVLAVIGIIAFWGKIIRILSPVIIAIILYHLVKPFIIKLENIKIKRGLGIILIYLGLLLTLAVSVTFFIPPLLRNTKELSDLLPEMIEDYKGLLNKGRTLLAQKGWDSAFSGSLIDEAGKAAETLKSFSAGVLNSVIKGLAGTARMVLNFIIALILVYYVLKDKVKFSNAITNIIPQKQRNIVVMTAREVNIIISNFIRGQLTAALIVGVMEAIGLYIAGIKYALIFGVIGGLANFIPYFGPFIGAIPAVGVTLLESPFKALIAAGIFFIVQQIDNTIISPRIIEGRLGLHPAATILAVYAGGEIGGVIGMLLAVPAVAIIRVIFRRSVEVIAG